jgi:DNA polymerase-3 subunit alpha
LFDVDDNAGPTASPALPEVPAFEPRQNLAHEKEVLGFYLTSHPLAEHEPQLRAYCSHTTGEAAALPHRTEVLLGGMIASLVTKRTKNPRPGSTNTKYAMFDLEDAEGIMRSIVWPEDYARLEPLVQTDAILVVRGTIDKRPGSDEANLIVNDLIPLDQLAERMTRGMLIRLDESRHTPKHVEQLYEIVRGYPGRCALELVFQLEDGSKLYSECGGVSVSVSPELRARVDDLLGVGHVKLLAAPWRQPQRNGSGNGRNGYGRNGNGYGRNGV